MTETSSEPSLQKTVYLIRHAESEENRRIASLGSIGSSLTRFSLPKSSDVWASVELLNVSAQVDSSVSSIGKQQIENVAQQLKQANFLEQAKVKLVAHSPLQRAQDTCYGLLGCRAAADDNDTTSDDNPPGIRVVSLDVIREKTPAEWLPGNAAGLRKRLTEFERWLPAQPESVIVIVGHSQFFKNLLNLTYKFGNCDVYKLHFDANLMKEGDDARTSLPPKDTLPPQWSDLERVFQCNLGSDDTVENGT